MKRGGILEYSEIDRLKGPHHKMRALPYVGFRLYFHQSGQLLLDVHLVERKGDHQEEDGAAHGLDDVAGDAGARGGDPVFRAEKFRQERGVRRTGHGDHNDIHHVVRCHRDRAGGNAAQAVAQGENLLLFGGEYGGVERLDDERRDDVHGIAARQITQRAADPRGEQRIGEGENTRG